MGMMEGNENMTFLDAQFNIRTFYDPPSVGVVGLDELSM